MGGTAAKRRTRHVRFGWDATPSANPSGSPGLPALGQRVRVLWDDLEVETWYSGTVKDVDGMIGEVLVLYDDGIEVWEGLSEGSGRLWALEEVEDAAVAVTPHHHRPTVQASPTTEEKDTNQVLGRSKGSKGSKRSKRPGEGGDGQDDRGGRDEMLRTASIDGRSYSMTDMTMQVMRDVGTWLSVADIVSAAGSRGWSFAAGDPETSPSVRSRLRELIRGCICSPMRRKHGDPVFARKEKGLYGLAEWVTSATTGALERVHGEECRTEGGGGDTEPPSAKMCLMRAPDVRGRPAQIVDDTAQCGMETQRPASLPSRSSRSSRPCQASEARHGSVHQPEVCTTTEMENDLVSALNTPEILEEHMEAVVGILEAANEIGTDGDGVPILDLERVSAPTKRKLYELVSKTPAISYGLDPTQNGFQIEDYGELPVWGRRKEKAMRGPAAPVLEQTPTAHEIMGDGFAYSEEDAASDDDDLFGDDGKWAIDLPDAQSYQSMVLGGVGDAASAGEGWDASRHISTCPLDLDVSPEEVADRITQICDFVAACIEERRLPSISLKSSTASRPAFTMESNSAIVRFSRMMIALDIIHENLSGRCDVTEDSGVTRVTQRDIYYIARSRSSSIKARQMMQTIQDVSLMLNVPRFAMGIDCRSKGMVYGPIAMGGATSCTSRRGTPISGSVPEIMNYPSVNLDNVTAILVVEKETVFQRIVRVAPSHPILSTCVIITGCGYPDVGTRAFLHRISGQNRSTPVMGLVDWNACGAHILSQYVSLLLPGRRQPFAPSLTCASRTPAPGIAMDREGP